MVDVYNGETSMDGQPLTRDDDASSEGSVDATAWRAARIILTRLVAEPSYAQIDASLRLTIERFLERHPSSLRD
jgi:hypothetical protein